MHCHYSNPDIEPQGGKSSTPKGEEIGSSPGPLFVALRLAALSGREAGRNFESI